MKKYCILNKQVLVDPGYEVCAGCGKVDECKHKNQCLTVGEAAMVESTANGEFVDLDLPVLGEAAAFTGSEDEKPEGLAEGGFVGGGGSFGGGGATGSFGDEETTEKEKEETTEEETTEETTDEASDETTEESSDETSDDTEDNTSEETSSDTEN
jgi:hypothetical protein